MRCVLPHGNSMMDSKNVGQNNHYVWEFYTCAAKFSDYKYLSLGNETMFSNQNRIYLYFQIQQHLIPCHAESIVTMESDIDLVKT